MADLPAHFSRPFANALFRWLRRTAQLLGALAILLVSVGVIYQLIGTWSDEHHFPRRGRSVQAGEVKLNIDCSGNRSPGSPAVILDSGMGVPAIGWMEVQPEVAKFARVCSYDRAGYGWSEAGPDPRTSLRVAKELKALLDTAGEQGPYVLVGHSFGGFNVRVFTGLYPAEVLGVVLVDAAHEDEEKRIDEMLPATVVERENKNDLWNERVNRFLAPFRIHLGIQRLQLATGWGAPHYGVLQATRGLPMKLRQEFLYLRQQPKFQNAVDSESKDFAESIAQVRAAGNLGGRPLIVLTAGKPYPPDPLLTKQEMDRQNNLWINVLQAQEAHLSTRGKQIVVSDSGHMIPFKRPDIVISAIHEVWSATQQETTFAEPGN